MCRDRSSDFKAPVSVLIKYMILESRLVCLHFNIFSIIWKIGGTLTSIQPMFCHTLTETLNRSDSNPRKQFFLLWNRIAALDNYSLCNLMKGPGWEDSSASNVPGTQTWDLMCRSQESTSKKAKHTLCVPVHHSYLLPHHYERWEQRKKDPCGSCSSKFHMISKL